MSLRRCWVQLALTGGRCSFSTSLAAPAKGGEIVATVRDALNAAIEEEMRRDDRVFLIGEEVAQYDGAYKVTKGLWKKFGSQRVVDTPITEMGFAGLAVGAAMAGLRPVIEFMSWNFAYQSFDHLINSAAKIFYMSAGRYAVPIVFRGPDGPAMGVAAQHSNCMGSSLAQVPGMKVVSPYSCEDARGLFKAAVRDPDPVVILENELLYGYRFPVSPQVASKDFVVPIGKGKVERKGKHATAVAYSIAVDYALKAAEELAKGGVELEVINMRSLRPLDMDLITDSVKKTGHLVTVEESLPHYGIGANLLARIAESDAFFFLDSPMMRVTGVDTHMPYTPTLEEASKPKPQDVVDVVKKMLGKK